MLTGRARREATEHACHKGKRAQGGSKMKLKTEHACHNGKRAQGGSFRCTLATKASERRAVAEENR